MLRSLVAQSVLDTLAAMLVIEALLRGWRLSDAASRLRLRLLVLALAVAVPPFAALSAGWRTPDALAGWTLLATERWNLLRLGGAGATDLAAALAAGLGTLLFLRDALPPVIDLVRRPRDGHEPAAPALAAGARQIVQALAGRLGIEPPAVRLIAAPAPVLLCEGAVAPALVVSPATLARLAPRELEAALAHELAHAAHRDPFWGYALLAARALTFFNPAAQWAARTIVDDLERRADETAVRLTGDAEALAGALRQLSESERPTPGRRGTSFEEIFRRARAAGVARRCARLAREPLPPPATCARLRIGLAAAGLATLAFLVV